ncbi:MAG: LysR family transcriptional regulator [Gammaproteobacteria bacterium]|nr:LysR family transcriptional regulator [Gammaproteobacteria bacterium]
MMIDLNDMLLFAQVVNSGSFTAAARELGMPKSTLSRRISNLESKLDSRLLHRTTRSLRLTDIGAEFYTHCVRVVDEAREAERLIHLNQDEPRGLLRVTGPIEWGNNYIGALVSEYLQHHPEVRLELILTNRFVDLVAEGFDLALRAGHLEDSSMIARRLGESRMLLCAAPAYLEQHGAPQNPEQLREHICLAYPGGDGRTTLQFSSSNSLSQVEINGRLVANSVTTLRDATIAGLGITALPSSLCRDALDQGLLLPIMQEWQLPVDGIYAVYPSPRHLTLKVRSFIDFIAERL